MAKRECTGNEAVKHQRWDVMRISEEYHDGINGCKWDIAHQLDVNPWETLTGGVYVRERIGAMISTFPSYHI